MQYSPQLVEKLKKCFPRAKGLHYQVDMGKEQLGQHIKQYIAQITEEQFARTFYLTPAQAQQQFPAFLQELNELDAMWESENSKKEK